MFRFAHPFLLLLLIPLVFLLYVRWRRNDAAMKFSSLNRAVRHRGIGLRMDRLFLLLHSLEALKTFFSMSLLREWTVI